MWSTFAMTVAAAVVLIYTPGVFVLRLFRRSWCFSLICAPVFSVLGYCLISIAYVVMGIGCSWFNVAAPYAIVVILAVFFGSCRSRTRCAELVSARNRCWSVVKKGLFDQRWLFVYLGFSILVALFFFILPLDGPGSVYQENDCYAHLESIREFINSGFYYDLGSMTYPQAWYNLVALVISFTQVDIGIAINAVNFVLIAISFPSGFYLLMTRYFPSQPNVVRWGSILVMAFAAFPWGLLYFGPLYPNASAFSLLPSVMVLFIDVLGASMKKRERIGRLAGFLLGSFALAILHPNAIFSMMILSAPFCVHLIWKTKGGGCKKPARLRIGWSVGFVLLVVVVWTALFVAPPLQGVVWFEWDPYLSVKDAFISAFELDLTKATVPQYAMGIVVFVGLAYCVITRKYIWIAVSYVVQIAIFVGSSALDGLPRHFLSGFWYSDIFRVAAMMVFVLIPLAALGMSAIFACARRLLSHLPKVCPVNHASAVVAILLSFLLLYLNFAPYLKIPGVGLVYNGFGQVNAMMSNGNNLQDDLLPYDGSEREFVERVKSVIPEGETVINLPHDGSTYAYGLDNLSILFHGWYGYSETSHPDEKELIRTRLSGYTADPEVKAALEKLHLKYVLILDQGATDLSGMYMGGYDSVEWRGITSINDETPGFKTVLAEGDKRLYELTDL